MKNIIFLVALVFASLACQTVLYPSPTPEYILQKNVQVPWLYTTAHQEEVECPIVSPDDVIDLVSITFGNESYFEKLDILGNGEIFPMTQNFGYGWSETNTDILSGFGNFHLADGYQQTIEDPGEWWLKISRCGEKLYYQKWQYNPNEGSF